MTQLLHSWDYPENPITYHRDMCNPMFITASFPITKSCESTDEWIMKIHYVYTCIYAYTHMCEYMHIYKYTYTLHVCAYNIVYR